jgi:leucyl-tRNA synthetase
MYLMFLGPFLEGGDFRDEGITGIRRFLEKVWTLAHDSGSADTPLSPAVERKLHQTIRKVTADAEALAYNTAIAAMMEYVNEVRTADGGGRKALEPLLVMLAPFAPHITEELWAKLGHQTSVFQASWPSFDPAKAAAGEVEVAVQVNGKLRARLNVPRGTGEQDVKDLALADEGVKKFVDGKPLRKVVYVQDRLLNLVV